MNNEKATKSMQRIGDAIENLVNRTSDGDTIAQREAYEALKALDRLEWFGNFGEEIQREVEFTRQRVVNMSNYESAEELRESMEVDE